MKCQVVPRVPPGMRSQTMPLQHRTQQLRSHGQAECRLTVCQAHAKFRQSLCRRSCPRRGGVGWLPSRKSAQTLHLMCAQLPMAAASCWAAHSTARQACRPWTLRRTAFSSESLPFRCLSRSPLTWRLLLIRRKPCFAF